MKKLVGHILIFSLGLFGYISVYPIKCDLCNQKIYESNNHWSNYWNEDYHEHHKGELPACYSCDRLISEKNCTNYIHKNGGKKIIDGRWVCNIYLRTSDLIYFNYDADELLTQITDLLLRKGISIPKIFDLNLVYEDELSTIRNSVLRHGEKNPALMSISLQKKTFANHINTNTNCKVYVLSGLERYFFISCLAHEMMHVWIEVNIGFDLHPKYEEGLCNYIAFKVLEDWDYHEYKSYNLAKIKQSPDPIYGDGFREIKKLAYDFPKISNLLNYIKYNPSKFGK